MSSSTSLLNEAFRLLDLATQIEECAEHANTNEPQRLEAAASKYNDACDLLRRAVGEMQDDASDEKVRRLLVEKMDHYRAHASNLLRQRQRPASMGGATTGAARNHHLVASEASPSAVFGRGTVVSSRSLSSSSSAGTTAVATWEVEATEKAGEANKHLSRALDLDERGNKTKDAIEQYMKSATLFLEALQVAEKSGGKDSSTGVMLTKRLESIIDRVEKLKAPKKQHAFDVVPKKWKGRGSNQTQQRSDSSLLSQASALSDSSKSTPSTGTLTAEEIEVLKRSSLIASGLFLPWVEDEARNFDFTAGPGKTLFVDPDGRLKLSEQQKKTFCKWARPSEIVALRNVGGGRGSGKPVMIRTITPYSIQQKAVTDCSFIASLCICAAHERRFNRRLVTPLIYPQDTNGVPIYNPHGKYLVKLWLNGVARRVVVDDLLPIDRGGNLLCSHARQMSSSDPLELWVSIIEKAYMKLCGGYDFPGSNSGVDLFSLTGWIPERIYFPDDESKLKDFETHPERAWERLYNANNVGDCLITVSTSSKLAEEDANIIGLVTGHAYAVLSVVKTRNGTRLLQLKNPWAHKSWKGKYSCRDQDSWSDAALQAEVGYNQKEASKHDDGIFWISWEDILVYFQNIHLSWNPALFESKVTVHGFWPKSQGPFDDSYNVSENPQYIMTLSDRAIKKKATVWILLSRHVTKQEQEGSDATDYLTLHIYRNSSNKDRIIYPCGKTAVLTGAYSNNPHVLIRYDLDGPEDTHLSLVFSQYKKSNDLGYTMSCFCTSSFVLNSPVKTPQHRTTISSMWTDETAGGNPMSPSFNKNPMYVVIVPKCGAHLLIKCSAVKTIPINVMLVQVDGADFHRAGLVANDKTIVMDTGDYRKGFVSTGVQFVASGCYVLVASTFYVGQTGEFVTDVCSSTRALNVKEVI